MPDDQYKQAGGSAATSTEDQQAVSSGSGAGVIGRAKETLRSASDRTSVRAEAMSESADKAFDLPDHFEGSMEAPVIYFEAVPNIGVHQGVGRVTLEMLIFGPAAGGNASKAHRKVVAHLRGPLAAFGALRAAIDHMKLAAAPPQGGEKPN
jgi:hypothetical protein